MELRWTVVKHEDEDRGEEEAVVVLEGSASATSAAQLAEELCALTAALQANRPTIDFSRVSGDVDALLASLLSAIRDGRAPELALSGLTQHQLRVLEYLGLFAAPGEPGRA